MALIIEQNASLAGAVGGCQAETGSAAAMGVGAIAGVNPVIPVDPCVQALAEVLAGLLKNEF
jgi:L-serine dehydratase